MTLYLPLVSFAEVDGSVSIGFEGEIGCGERLKKG